jgi:uncharacterized protein with FMN-binding domain
MKRSPLIVAGSIIGVASALALHMADGSIILTMPPSVSTTTTIPTSRSTTTSTSRSTTTPTTTTATHPGPPTTKVTTTTHPATTTVPTTRTVTGPLVNYSYGTLSVSVTATGSNVTKIVIASLNDGGNPRSQSIDSASIPQLVQEAISAKSANIQSISGASYTSAGFIQSLQGALTGLGL